MSLTTRSLSLLVAIVLFVLAGIGLDDGPLNIVALGLAAFAAAFLVPDTVIGTRR